MNRLHLMACFFIFTVNVFSQNSTSGTLPPNLNRPKLVVGMMVDQMRWDFLYRFYDRYGEGGFKRLIAEGFSCDNTMIPYAQTLTAAGHACVYTGSVPAINGIMGNDWYDRSKGNYVYCVEDSGVSSVGGNPAAEPMSPKNLLTTTIGDELMLATNFRSKVVGIAVKDRGAILPAGHSGEAYWYDPKIGNYVTSTYYKNKLPDWVSSFNARKLPDSLYALEWNTLFPIETYVQSDNDLVAYEGRFAHETSPTFPHILSGQIGTNYGTINSTPYGNIMTFEFGKAAVLNESMGKDDITDLLAISFSSPDYVGHQFGPNSVEAEDIYLRLDAALAEFFNFLDKEVGKGQWSYFLTADHAVAHVPGFMKKHNLPAGTPARSTANLNKLLEEKFKIANCIVAEANYHLYYNLPAIENSRKTLDEIIKYSIAEIEKDTAVLMAFDARSINAVNMPEEMKNRYLNGYHKKLSGEVIVVLKSGHFYGSRTGTTHGSWYPYDAHIPLVFMGKGIKHGKTNRLTYMSDIAPTIAALLHIQPPSGSIGVPVLEVTD